MRLRWFIPLVLVPVVEILVLVEVARAIGWLLTIVVLVGTSVLGALVMRRAGVAWWRALRGRVSLSFPDPSSSSTRSAGSPADEALRFLAGVALFVPGFVTDMAGLLLLTPPARSLLRGAAAAWFARRFVAVTGPGGVPVWTRPDRVIRGQVVRDDGPEPGASPPRPATPLDPGGQRPGP